MSEGIPEDGSLIKFSPFFTLYLCLLLFLSVLPAAHSSSCMRPFSVQHGRVNGTEANRGSFPIGTVLQYSCESTYSLEGPNIIICTKEGLWSSPPPRCLHNVYCVAPSVPENGGYTCHPSPCRHLSHGTVVQYFCNEGYILKGDYKYLTCQRGQWSGPMQISCVLNKGCMRPFSIPHGQVNSTETNTGSSSVGTVLQYSCDAGYSVEGSSIIVCTKEGLWSSPPPRCLHNTMCSPPFNPENGGYTCHPSPCHRLTHGTVVEYFCDEGYTLKGDYKYLTCQNGNWNSLMQISCVLNEEHHVAPMLGMDTLSIVATTASSVALVLLLVVTFVLLQPKLKSLHSACRREVRGSEPVTIMVEGVQVTLPSYEEAVSGASGNVLDHPQSNSCLESLEQLSAQTSMTPHTEDTESRQPPSTSSSSWSLDGAQGAIAVSSLFQCQNPDCSQQNTLFSPHCSEQDMADDIPLLKES